MEDLRRVLWKYLFGQSIDVLLEYNITPLVIPVALVMLVAYFVPYRKRIRKKKKLNDIDYSILFVGAIITILAIATQIALYINKGK